MLAAAFGSIARSRSHLEELQNKHSEQLDSLRDSLNQTLQRCGRPCGSVSLDSLAFSTNFSTVRRGRVWGEGPPQPLPQPPHAGLFPVDPRCGAAAGGTGRSVWLQHISRFRGGKGFFLHPGKALGAPGAAGAVCEGVLRMYLLARANLLFLIPLSAGGNLAVLCHLGMEGMCCSALGCGQGHELHAVPPRLQVNNTLHMAPEKVQEQAQDVVTSKQCYVPNFTSPRESILPSDPITAWRPLVLPPYCLQPWLSPHPHMLLC